MELKYVLIAMCVYCMTSTCVSGVLVVSTQCHLLDRKAPKPIVKNRLRIYDVDVYPVQIALGVRMFMKFSGIRKDMQLSESPSENVRVHLTLTWKPTQVSRTIQGEADKPAQYSNYFPELCKFIEDPSKCPIAAQREFTTNTFYLDVPTDAVPGNARLKIELKNNRNQLLGCYIVALQSPLV